MATLRVGDAMEPIPEGIPQELPLDQVIARFAREARTALPVVGRDGTYRGTVTARLVEESMRTSEPRSAVGELARETPAITEDQNLEQALTVLVHSEDSGVPVLSADRRTVVGWLTHQDVLRAYHERIKPTSVAPKRGEEFP